MNRNNYYKVIGVVILILILCMQQCRISKLKTDIAMKDINIYALKDTIKQTTDKLGNVQYEKSVLISSESGLKSLNSDLYKDVQNQKGKVAYLQSITASFKTKHDTVKINVANNGLDTSIKNNTANIEDSGSYILSWNGDKQYDTSNFRKLSGNTKFSMQKGKVKSAYTEILNDEINFNIKTGLVKKDKKGDIPAHYEIFVKSDYPGFKPTKIDGAFIPQKDLFPPQANKKWAIGPVFSAGIGLGGANSSALSPVIYAGVGIGVMYKLFSF